MSKALRQIFKDCITNSTIPKRKRKFKTEEDMLKYFLKREYKAIHSRSAKKLVSLMVDERTYYDEESECAILYGFIPGSEDCSDEEIREILKEEWVHIYSPYDCTGKWFTWTIDWHRNPSGIVSYQHRMCLDV